MTDQSMVNCPRCGRANPAEEAVCAGCGEMLYGEPGGTGKASSAPKKLGVEHSGLAFLLYVLAAVLLAVALKGMMGRDLLMFVYGLSGSFSAVVLGRIVDYIYTIVVRMNQLVERG